MQLSSDPESLLASSGRWTSRILPLGVACSGVHRPGQLRVVMADGPSVWSMSPRASRVAAGRDAVDLCASKCGGHVRDARFLVAAEGLEGACGPVDRLNGDSLGSFGLGEGNEGNLGSALIGVVFVLGCITALRLVGRVGRRPVIVRSFALMVVPLAVLGGGNALPMEVVIVCFCAYALLSGGPTALEWTYPNELFPHRHPGRRGRRGDFDQPCRRRRYVSAADLPGSAGHQCDPADRRRYHRVLCATSAAVPRPLSAGMATSLDQPLDSGCRQGDSLVGRCL
ncbi:MFS transporter [Streptomyces sp. KL2]|uniref:MFS transporter n=1 Tax=Streptomyces sp. KL2 TaxID=3050126 RepID=UPI0039794D79